MGGAGLDGVGRGGALDFCWEGPSATARSGLPLSPPPKAVKPTKPMTTTIAATMAAVQLGRPRIGPDPLRLEQWCRGGGYGTTAVIVVVLRDQRGRIEADGLGERTDVTACVHIAAAPREVVLLDRVHDGDAHPRGGTDLVDRQSGGDTGLLECATDRWPVVFDRRPVVFGRVADGHGGAFRA